MRNLKVGDKVRVSDSSYVFGLCNGVYGGDDYPNLSGIFTVLAINLQVKKKAKPFYGEEFCDTLVTNEKGDYWFVLARLTRLQTHTISVDGGKKVELSNESYENLKKELGK